MHRRALIFRIAERQQGFFTAKQALAAGYARKSLSRMVETKQWTHVDRGLYRLSLYPYTERPDLMQWYLWSRDRNDVPQGVFSHRTALDLYGLTDDMPVRLEMTVPPSFRKAAEGPLYPILHTGIVAEADIRHIYGVKVTKPLKTIIDLLLSGFLFGDLLHQAISNALDTGLLASPRQLLDHPVVRKDASLKRKIEEAL